MEKISIIVPIYNLERYLKECIESILNQSYKNIEVILIDDGSTDRSLKICKDFEIKDKRILVIHQENSGVSVARNTGIKYASGEWIMFVDPDDYLDENIVTELYKQTKIYTKADIISCCCEIFTNDNFLKNSFFYGDRVFEDDFKGKKDIFIQLMNPQHGQPNKALTAIGVPWGKLYRKSMININNLEFKPNLRRMQDNIFNSYAFWYANQIIYIDYPLYYYRLEHFNEYERSFNKNIDVNFYNVIKERKRFLEYINIFNNEEIKDEFYYESFKYITAIINRKILHKEYCISYLKRLKKMSELCKENQFKEIIDNIKISKIPSLKHKLEAIILKKRLYFVFERGIRLNNILKNNIKKVN